MRKKSDAEMKRLAVAKVTRSLVRLKHSLAADEEINALLPETLGEFDEAMGRGELLAVQAGLADVLEAGRAAQD